MTLLENIFKKIVQGGLYTVLFTPFIFWKTLMYPFVTLKVFGFHILMEVIFAAWLIYLLLRQEKPKITWVSLALLALLIVLLLTAITGVNLSRSFWSTQERGIGIFSLLHFAAFFFVLADFLRRGLVRLKTYLKVAAVVGLGLGVGAVLEIFWPQLFLFSGGGRSGSFLGNPTYLASYLLLQVFIVLWLAVNEKKLKKRLVWLGLTIFDVVVIIFLTQTRGAMIGLATGIIFLLFWFARRSQGKIASPEELVMFRYRNAARLLLVFIFIFAAVFWFTRTAPLWQTIPGVNRLTTLFSGNWDVGPRLLSWRVAWKSFLERPFSGWGFENFKYAMDRNFEPSLFRYGFGETYWDKPHNIFLEYLVAGGIWGLAALFALFVVAFRAVWRLPLGIFFAAALVAHLVSNTFVFDTFGSYLMFFVILAAIDSVASFVLFSTAVDRRQSVTEAVVMKHHQRSGALKSVAATAVIIGAFTLVAYNINILYANNRHYWGANYFANNLPEKALDSFRHSLDTKFNPYVNATRRDFGDLVTQMYKQKRLPAPEKNLPWAVSEVDKAIGDDPQDYYLYLVLADMIVNFYQLNPNQLLPVAQAAINKAIELSPNRQQNYYVKAKLHLIKNEDKEAVAAMEKAVSLDPQIGDPHFYYALTLLEIGETEKGFAELKTAEELGRLPRTAEEARTVANYYGDAQNWEKAVFWYKIALTKDPSDNEARLKLGLVYYLSGQKELAREEIAQVIKKTDLKQSPAYDLLLPILNDLKLTP